MNPVRRSRWILFAVVGLACFSGAGCRAVPGSSYDDDGDCRTAIPADDEPRYLVRSPCR